MWSSGESQAGGEDPEVLQELLEDFAAELQETHQYCEAILMGLERKPDDSELLRSLFQSVHTLKGNLSFVHMRGFMPLLQSVEDVLDDIRHGRMHFDDALSDVILLALDVTHRLVGARMEGAELPVSKARFGEICQAIQAIAATPAGSSRDERVLRAVRLLDPNTCPGDSAPALEDAGNAVANISGVERLLEKYGVSLDDSDLVFFRSLIAPMEMRSIYWVGRTERLLKLALAMNEQAGYSVDAAQLAAAVFVHNIGMAFLPLDVLHKRGEFTSEERRLMNAHPAVGAELLGGMARWRSAAKILLQHHEHSDGSGYPRGLKDAEICDGAKILAIAECFDARTHERAYRTVTKRPFIRAVLEINNCSGLAFAERWVQIFNDTVRDGTIENILD